MAYKSKFKGKEIDDRLDLVKELSEEIKDKQDNIEDLEDIRDGANKGAKALQSIPEEYVTETELEGKGYATVTQVNEKQDAIFDLDTIRANSKKAATALQEIPSEYITESELNNKGFLTQHQDITHLATKSELTSKLNNKVDKVNGKQLSTEDFTTALKNKLSSLSNYDDSTIKNSIGSLQSQINTLINGDVSTAIETFNEIIVFLSGIEDTESLSGIIASIETQISNAINTASTKQDTLISGKNIKTINGESILGEGNINIERESEIPDLEGYATEEYVDNAVEEVNVKGEDGYVYSNGEKVDMRFTRSLIPVGTSIPAKADLNTVAYLKVGKYYCSLNADAKTITNCPTANAFMMEVFNPLSTVVDNEIDSTYVYRIRILTEYSTGIQYVQYCTVGSTVNKWTYDSWYICPRTKFTLNSSKNDGSAAIGSKTQGVYVDSTGTLQKMTYSLNKTVPSNAVFTDTDTKVTDVVNHYAPVEDESVSIEAPEGEVVIGLKRDAAGHVVGVMSTPMSSGEGGGEGEVQETSIVASQIFLELHSSFDDFQVFSHKSGYEEHNREVCQRLIENCFTDKAPNNEMFFVTINGLRDGVPYMETAILESQAVEVVRASFVKGNINPSNSIAASIGILSIDAENLRSYAEAGEDLFYWRYTSTRVPSIDAIGSEDESDVYVTEFTFEQITTNNTAVTVSPELVNAIYNKRIIVIPSRVGNYIATNTYSNPPLTTVNLRMQIATGVSIYDVALSAKGPAPQTAQTFVTMTNLLYGRLNTINGASIAAGVDMPLVSSISLNGKTYTPTKGAVDLGNIEGTGGQQQLKTIFGQSIVGEGDVLDNYSMEITDVGTYAVNSIVNPRIVRAGNIFPLVVDEFVQINYGPTLNVRISSDGTLTVSGSVGAIGGIPTSYLASGVIPEEYMPKNVATLDDIQQADFDEYDVESKAYIKNRTHYFYPYGPAQQLIVDATTIGTNIASISHYFKIGGAVYRPADMVGVEFNCQNAGPSVFVTVVEELNSDGKPSFYLRHISGNSSSGEPIMIYSSGDVKTIDDVYIPNGVARTKDLNVRNVCIVDTEDEIDDTISFATMATRKIKDAKDLDTGELIYIKGNAKATYMSDGRTVEDAINNMSSSGGGGVYVTTLVYKATSKVENTIYPWSDTTFGASIIQHNYNDTTKEGVIYCSDRITTIAVYAFLSCINLTSITIPDSVTTIKSSAFSDCKSLTSVTIGDSVTTIGGGAFQNCSNLTSVNIPDSVTAIRDAAFSGCSSLTSITIPDSVTTIGDVAFRNCSSLTSVYCKAVTPPAGGYEMFYGNASGRKIYVPMESVEEYKSASYWSEYADSIVGYHYNVGLFKTINGESIVGEGNISIESGTNTMVSISWEELVNTRDSGELIPGTYYRIIDYVTTTTQENTGSAGNLFDVIVFALDEHTLSEEAYAIQSERDTDGYFANSNLAAWKLWYCLDNDTSRFAWAAETGGTGVIYRMIDEFGNDCPYDFKNILFVRYKLGLIDYYDPDKLYDMFVSILIENVNSMLEEEQASYIWAGTSLEYGKYWEDNYSIAYSNNLGERKMFFTFSDITEYNSRTITYDASLQSNCYNNKIMGNETPSVLPNNVFFGNFCNNNRIGYNSQNNSFGDDCYHNILLDGCSDNTFSEGCAHNRLSSYCSINNFCSYNTSNSLDSDCYSNTFGISTYNNTLGKGCYCNVLSRFCDNNSLGQRCECNSFQAECRLNILSPSCSCNYFGIGHFYMSNFLGIGVNNVALSNEEQGDYVYVQNYRVSDGVCGEEEHPLIIETERGRNYTTIITRNSNGEIVQFCEGDNGGGKNIQLLESPTIDVLEPNKIYVYATSEPSSITINSFSTTDALTEEYVIQFRTFALAESITLPSGVMWANGVTPTLEGGTLYELSIVKTHIGGTDYFKAVLTPFK